MIQAVTSIYFVRVLATWTIAGERIVYLREGIWNINKNSRHYKCCDWLCCVWTFSFFFQISKLIYVKSSLHKSSLYLDIILFVCGIENLRTLNTLLLLIIKFIMQNIVHKQTHLSHPSYRSDIILARSLTFWSVSFVSVWFMEILADLFFLNWIEF